MRLETPLVVPTHFASSEQLTGEQLRAAPIRYPCPSRLARELRVKGARAAQAAASLGLCTVGDLLGHLPRDRREACGIGELSVGETATIVAEVRRIAARPVRRRGMRPIVEATVADGTGTLRAAFFNQPWLVDRYPAGTRVILHGKADGGGRFSVQAHAPAGAAPAAAALPATALPATALPATALPGAALPGVALPATALPATALPGATLPGAPPALGSDPEAGRAGVAHYPASEGLSSTQILALVHEHARGFDDVMEPLPAALRLRGRLPDRAGAMRTAHFSQTEGDREQGRRRLAFDELLLEQMALLRRRRRRRSAENAPMLDGQRELTARWLERQLPFTLTAAQCEALEAIDADIATGEPMQRLLMGEVGSGKTVVALYAMLRAVEHGFQAALMAPTETLAEQHFQTITRLLGSEPVSAGLLTGSTPASRRAGLVSRLATGELSLVVGTHALIEEAVSFRRLAVAVIDEQHRFGVGQRAALAARGHPLVPDDASRRRNHDQVAHELHMTATPIPRTLALSRYGDLDLTSLRELPSGRRPIATHVCSTEAERERAYARIREELDAGRQAFVVCPLVEESETMQVRAARSEYERLRAGAFAGYAVVLVHGQMRSADKQAAMRSFGCGKAQVLVATTVIEVGIDVPNATVMLVEDADRYGISQLHQLRGRVGRGAHPSLCLLFGRRESQRLRALERESDGFRLAEVDLVLRGHGELAGTRQSGHEAGHRFVDLTRDAELMERAASYARAILDDDPDLQAPEHALMEALLPVIRV